MIEGSVIQNLVSDSEVSPNPDEDHKAHFFKAWYKTDGINNASCILVSGVTVVMHQEIASFNEETTKVMVGREPCHCGIFSCEYCPVFETKTTKTPNFKPHKLSMLEQEALVDRMRVRMVEFGKSLLASHPEELPALQSTYAAIPRLSPPVPLEKEPPPR